LIAVTLAPAARHVLFASPSLRGAAATPSFSATSGSSRTGLSLRLGEGTAPALFIHLARAAALVWSQMATIQDRRREAESEGGDDEHLSSSWPSRRALALWLPGLPPGRGSTTRRHARGRDARSSLRPPARIRVARPERDRDPCMR